MISDGILKLNRLVVVKVICQVKTIPWNHSQAPHAENMKTVSAMGECKRCGQCCQDVRLAESPETLERAYTFWRKSSSIDPLFSEIYLIYPMLTFSYEEKGADFPYHYHCKHYTLDSRGVPACSIHPIRPRMCRQFPHYDDVVHLDRNEPASPYPGCGYNEGHQQSQKMVDRRENKSRP